VASKVEPRQAPFAVQQASSYVLGAGDSKGSQVSGIPGASLLKRLPGIFKQAKERWPEGWEGNGQKHVSRSCATVGRVAGQQPLGRKVLLGCRRIPLSGGAAITLHHPHGAMGRAPQPS
jgi:hypothetical protein